MKAFLEQMQVTCLTWWSARQPRERQILLAGGGVLGTLLVFTLLVLPLLDRHQALRAELPLLRGSVVDLEAKADEAVALRSQGVRAAGAGGATAGMMAPAAVGTALSASPGRVTAVSVEASARAAGLRSQMETFSVQPDGRIDITAARTTFDAILAWLDQIQRAGGVTVQSLDADALDAPGQVRLKLQLQLSGRP